MNTLKRILKDKWIYIAAFTIPFLIGIFHSALADTWISGHGNISIGDLNSQTIPVAYEIWDRFHASDWSLFTWHIMDGLCFDNSNGYMSMNSIFTVFMMLIPRKMIPDYIQLIMLVKWSLCALTMTYFFYNTEFNKIKAHKRITSLFLGLAFAMGNGVISFLNYPSFLSVLIIFPILLLLVEKLIEHHSFKLYYLFLTYALWADMYTSYQVCLFLVIWFFMVVILNSKKNVIKSFIIFAGISLLSGLTWIGGIFVGISNASNRHQMDDAIRMDYYLNYLLVKPVEFIKQLFTMRNISGVNDFLPDIYFSVTALFFVLMYPMIKIERRKKIYSLVISVFLIAGFFFGRVSLIWHMFTIPNGLYHRYKNIFVFVMLFMVMQVFIHLNDLELKHLIISSGILVITAVLTLINIDQSDSYQTYFISFLLIAFLVIIFVLFKKKSINYKNVICIIAICGIVELCINAGNAFSYYDGELFYGENGITDNAVEVLKKAKTENGERIVSSYPTANIGMITGQNSDSGFISTLNMNVRNLHLKLGMCVGSNVMFGCRGASPLLNLIFNIRYGHGEGDMLFSDAQAIAKDEYCSLYRLERLAGLGYMVESDLKQWKIDEGDCFELQNDFVNKAVHGDDIFYPVDIDVMCIDSEYNICEPEHTDQDPMLYSYNYVASMDQIADARQLEITAGEDADLYMMYNGNNAQILVYIDGEFVYQDGKSYPQSTYHIGKVKKGQKISVCAIPEAFKKGDLVYLNFRFSKFDNNIYDGIYEKLSKNTYSIDTFESDYVKGKVHADEEGIMMTSIPAIDGFHVLVDGVETRYSAIGDAFIGVPVEKGDHIIEFQYKSKSSWLHIIIMLVSFTIYILLCILFNRSQNVKGKPV